MKVILLQDIKNIGRKNDIKNLTDGYVRNFLLPKKLAKIATPQATQEIESFKNSVDKWVSLKKSRLNSIMDQLENNPLKIGIKIGENKEIFGSIHKDDVKRGLVNAGLITVGEEVNINLDRPIKKLGITRVEIDMGRGVKGEIKIEASPQQF